MKDKGEALILALSGKGHSPSSKSDSGMEEDIIKKKMPADEPDDLAEPDDMSGPEEELAAEDVMKAFKSGDAASLAEALSSFVKIVQSK